MGSVAFAQVYTAGKIQFVNPGPYSHDELEAVAGIHPGTKFTADDLSASAQKLADTGYFDDVTASLEGRFAAMTVTYQLKPAATETMLPVGFQNFVWLTQDEIDGAVKAKLPLFRGYLPEGSTTEDVLAEALKDALAAKGVRASVVYETAEPTLAHPKLEIEYRVSKPYVQVSDVKLAGVSSELLPYVQQSVKDIARTPYRSDPGGLRTTDALLKPLFDAGYIEAALDGVQTSISTMPDGGEGVALSASLDAGAVYKVSGIVFAGAPLFSADEFAAKAKLHAGDVASRKNLMQTLEPLDSAYRRRGYMDVRVIATPNLEKQAQKVAYAVSVTPGEQYRIHEVTAENLDPQARAVFDRLFSMKAGDLYNPEYVTEFLAKNAGTREFQPYSGNYVAYAHPKTHTVDLVISFARR